jgi:hypothetical protein
MAPGDRFPQGRIPVLHRQRAVQLLSCFRIALADGE